MDSELNLMISDVVNGRGRILLLWINVIVHDNRLLASIFTTDIVSIHLIV